MGRLSWKILYLKRTRLEVELAEELQNIGEIQIRRECNATMNEQLYQKLLKEENARKNNYIIQNNILYRKKGERILKVIRRHEIEPVLYFMHDHLLAAHFGITTTQERVKEKYFWPGMNKDIEDYVKSCDQYQRRGRKNNKHKLHSIEMKEPFYCIGIDIVGPLLITGSRNRYIVVAVDYFTKWPEAKAIKHANAEEVAEFIFEEIICRHGCPRTIIQEEDASQNETQIQYLIDEHPRKVNQARENIKRSQEKQRLIHDKKIKEKLFKVGEKVLYYKAIKDKQWTGKLEENWKGPYYIHEILLNGAYKLKDDEGNIMRVPINGELLKHYYSREGYVPFIVIEPGGSKLRAGEFVTKNE